MVHGFYPFGAGRQIVPMLQGKAQGCCFVWKPQGCGQLLGNVDLPVVRLINYT